jgi:hypothetical protein
MPPRSHRCTPRTGNVAADGNPHIEAFNPADGLTAPPTEGDFDSEEKFNEAQNAYWQQHEGRLRARTPHWSHFRPEEALDTRRATAARVMAWEVTMGSTGAA